MISTDDLAAYQATVIGALEAGLKQASAGGCGVYRLRKVSFNGVVAFGASQIAEQITDNTPLAPTISTTEEARSVQTQESTDASTQETQRGGDKIFGRTTTSDD